MIAIDMPMPNRCIDCRLNTGTGCAGTPDRLYLHDDDDPEYDAYTERRMSWCPLINLNDKKEGATHE